MWSNCVNGYGRWEWPGDEAMDMAGQMLTLAIEQEHFCVDMTDKTAPH